MGEIVLEAQVRAGTGKKVKVLRREGVLPAVVYGAGIDATPISLNALETSRLLEGVGASTLIELKIGSATHQVLVREIQRDVIRLNLLHVDFLKVAMDETIRTEVPVELVGESPAVKELGGLLVSGLSEVEVEALPADLPDRIQVDIGQILEMDDVITVADLKFSPGVEVLTSLDEVIASVVYQEEEILEEEELFEELMPEGLEPEVVERGKRTEDEDSVRDEND